MKRGRSIGVLQARTTSSRLPGKVLLPVVGQPLILRQLERIQRAETIEDLVVATSMDQSDDELAQVIERAGYQVVRGPLDDVLARFLQVIDTCEPDAVVRFTADCPLIAPSVIDLVVRRFHACDADYVSNTMIPTYPDGLDVEVVTSAALREVANASADPHEREHVTLGVYRDPERFRIENVSDPSGLDHADLRWTVDVPDDLAFVRSVYEELLPVAPAFDYPDVLNLLQRKPELRRSTADIPRNTALDGLDTGAMRHNPAEQR